MVYTFLCSLHIDYRFQRKCVSICQAKLTKRGFNMTRKDGVTLRYYKHTDCLLSRLKVNLQEYWMHKKYTCNVYFCRNELAAHVWIIHLYRDSGYTLHFYFIIMNDDVNRKLMELDVVVTLSQRVALSRIEIWVDQWTFIAFHTFYCIMRMVKCYPLAPFSLFLCLSFSLSFPLKIVPSTIDLRCGLWHKVVNSCTKKKEVIK